MFAVWIFLAILGLIIIILITIKGLKLCYNNNGFGVLLLFISLNLFGLITGIAILWNNNTNKNIKNKEHKNELEIYNILNEEKKKKVCGICFKIKNNQETLCNKCLKLFKK